MNALKTRGVLGGKVLDKWSLHAICSSLAQINPQQRIINHDPPLFFREFDWCASCCGWTQGKDTCSFVADYLSFSSTLWSMWFKFTTIPVVRKMKNQLVYNYKSDMQWKLALLIFVHVCWGKHCTISPPKLRKVNYHRLRALTICRRKIRFISKWYARQWWVLTKFQEKVFVFKMTGLAGQSWLLESALREDFRTSDGFSCCYPNRINWIEFGHAYIPLETRTRNDH